MKSAMMSKKQLIQMIVLIAMGLLAFYTVAHGPLFDQFRAVDIVLLVSTGLCFGVALSLLLSRFK
jgi:hypothetical protein